MHVSIHPAESGSLRPYFLASILGHFALIALAPFVFATSTPRPLTVADDDGGGDWPETVETPAPEPPPAAEQPDPTPPPTEPEVPDTISDSTPPPAITPPPAPTQRVVPQTPTRPTTSRSSASNRPGPVSVSPRLGGPIGGGSGVQSPKPAYPYQARRMRLTGSGRVTAWTDPAGRVIRCEVSGLPGMLTEYTRQFVLENWRGPAGAQFTREIEYRLE